MHMYISQKEFDSFNQKLANLKKEKDKLMKTLGKIMETSGSFASKTPGFNETENQIKNLDRKIAELSNFLNKSAIIKDISCLKPDEVSIYSLVSVLDTDNQKEIKYYIQYESNNNAKKYRIASLGSPIGVALIGKRVGDKIRIELLQQTLNLEIIKIEQILKQKPSVLINPAP